MAKKNSIDNQTGDLTIDPGASGDSWIQHSINGTGEYRVGVDDTAGDSFKISQGSALGTNDLFIMTADGQRTMPLQPAFLASVPVVLNITGDGTNYQIGSVTATTEIFDQGGDYVTSGTFTAPITGRYLLGVDLTPNTENPGGGDWFVGTIVTSNRTYTIMNLPSENRYTGFYGATTFIEKCCLVIADMDASDTATWHFIDGGGAKVDDLYGRYVYGALLC